MKRSKLLSKTIAKQVTSVSLGGFGPIPNAGLHLCNMSTAVTLLYTNNFAKMTVGASRAQDSTGTASPAADARRLSDVRAASDLQGLRATCRAPGGQHKMACARCAPESKVQTRVALLEWRAARMMRSGAAPSRPAKNQASHSLPAVARGSNGLQDTYVHVQRRHAPV